MSEEVVTPNDDSKTNTLGLSKPQILRLSQGMVEAVYSGAGETAPTVDSAHTERDAKLDKIAHAKFEEFVKAYWGNFESNLHCESSTVAKAHGRERRIYADLFGRGDAHRAHSAVEKVADMDSDLLVAAAWAIAKKADPKAKKADVEAGLKAAGLV